MFSSVKFTENAQSIILLEMNFTSVRRNASREEIPIHKCNYTQFFACNLAALSLRVQITAAASNAP